MDLHLTDRIAVVTGASSGIGLAIARALVAEGARVVTGSRTVSPGLAELADSGRLTAVTVDLATADGPAELVARAEELGGVDVLVNNVGAVTTRPDGFLTVDDDAWDRTLQLSFFTALRAIRAAVPSMRRRGGGNVVTVGSVNAFLPDPFVVDYSVAKAAVWNLSKALSQEFGPDRIRFNTVSPGPVATPLWLGEHGVASRRPSRPRRASMPRRPSDRPRAGSPPAGSPSPKRSPTSCCCSPATVPATSPEPTSSSTAASSRPSEPHRPPVPRPSTDRNPT